MPTKRLIRKVDLRFFNDDANGEWGLAHADTIGREESFNAFWTGDGIFHDVFEHAHEFVNKYFRDENAMNMGGEVAAMGALWYYLEKVGISRLTNSFRSWEDVVMNSTFSDMQDAIQNDNCRYGYELTCGVPRQRNTGNRALEVLIQSHFEAIRETKPEGEHGKAYRKSVTLSKLMRLYRYGYRMAQRLCGRDVGETQYTLNNFIPFWNNFCKQNDAGELANYYQGITFKVYRKTGGGISWVAQFNPRYGYGSEWKALKVTSEQTWIPSFMDDFMA